MLHINQILYSQKIPILRPIGSAMGCILWGFLRKLTAVYWHRIVFGCLIKQTYSPKLPVCTWNGGVCCSFSLVKTSSRGKTFLTTGLYEGNPPVTSGFPSQRASERSFDVSFDVCKWLVISDATPVIWCQCNVEAHSLNISVSKFGKTIGF